MRSIARMAGSVLTFLLMSVVIEAQTTATITGMVRDGSGNPLGDASVTAESGKGTVTNADGVYALKIGPGVHIIVISYVGQTAQRFRLTLSAGQLVSQDATFNGITDLSGVVVVGSRSKFPRSKLSTSVPVDVISTREIKQFAQTDLSQMLTYVAPSFQSARQTISDGTDHIDPAGLRGLGPDQTLMLVNGKRRHNTALVNINGTVGRGSVGTDLNTIPAAAIERIEVLRDGAAAQYGSDAIAGVINVVLKKNYRGFNVSAMTGENFTSMPYKGHQHIQDGLTRQVDFSAGYSWKNAAFLTLSGQWLKRDASNRSGDDNTPLVYYGNGGTLPPSSAVPAGVSPTQYYQWLMTQDNAKVQQRNYDRHNIIAGNSAQDNLGLFLNGGTQVIPGVDLYITTGMSHRTGASRGFSRNPNSWSQLPVKADNSSYYPDGFLPEIHTTIDDYSLLTGFKIDLGKWNVDLSNTLGQNSLRYNVQNTGNASLPAADNVQTAFYAGKLRFLQNTVNLDFSRKLDIAYAQSLNIAFGGEYRYENFRIYQGELNSYANGGRTYKPDSIPAYPAPGTKPYYSPGGPAVPGAQVFPGFQPGDAVMAHRNVYAAYGDLEYTVNKFLADVAGRYETYKELDATYGNLSGKLSARYDITKMIAVRGSVNSGFRAPSLHQRYFQNTSTQFVAGVPTQAFTANNYNPIVRNAFGVKELKPETSSSFTAGVVGNFSAGFSITIDAYQINIKDRIVLSTQFSRSNPLVNNILNANNVDPSVSGLQFWTNAVDTRTRGIDVVATNRFTLGTGKLTVSVAGNFNDNKVVGDIKTNSVIDDPKNNPSTTNPNANPAFDLKFGLFDRQQRSRIEVAQPKTKINITLTYDWRSWNFMARTVGFGKVQYINNNDPLLTRPDGSYWNDVGFGTDQTFAAKWTTDLVITWNGKKGISVSAGATNLFDIYPDRIYVDPRNDPAAYYATPVTTGANKTTGGYNASRDASNRGRFLFPANQFGFNGRFLFARLNLDIQHLVKK